MALRKKKKNLIEFVMLNQIRNARETEGLSSVILRENSQKVISNLRRLTSYGDVIIILDQPHSLLYGWMALFFCAMQPIDLAFHSTQTLIEI
jgi:hypothetical protein